jgi:hypothetical protein
MNKRKRKKALKALQAITRQHFLPVYVRMLHDPRWGVIDKLLRSEPKAPTS